MAISFPGVGAAAGSIGQMLMAKALQDREREDRASERKDITDLRREQALSSRLGALGATGDAFLPYTPGMKPPETAEPVNVMGESFFRVPKAPAAPKLPPTVETSSGIFTRGGAGLEPVIDPVTRKPAMPYQAPPQPREPTPVNWQTVQTREGFAQVHPRTGETRQLGIQPRTAGAEGALPDMTQNQERAFAQLPDVARGMGVINEIVGEHGVPSLAEYGLARTPIVGQFMLPEQAQRFENAARLAGTAIVRWESGAAIRPNEVEETANKKYVPRPGDKPELVKQKLAALRNKFHALSLVVPPEYTQELGIDVGSLIKEPETRTWQDRARELKAQGMAPDDVIVTLRSEGLLR